MKIYTSKYDRCFKCIHLNPSNQDLLLLQIYQVTGIKLNMINYSNVERNSDNIFVKRKTLDCLIDSELYSFNIEVNAKDEEYVKPRNTSYNCDVYSNDTKIRGVYDEKKDIIQINYSYGLKYNEAVRVYTISDESNNQYVKNFKIYEINMDYIMNFWYNRNKQQSNFKCIYKYRYFIMLNLKYDELNELIKMANDERIVKYMKELMRVNSNPKFRRFISEEEDQQFIKNSLIAQGEKLGERRGKIDIAKKSLKANLSLDTISQITGLTFDEISKIKV